MRLATVKIMVLGLLALLVLPVLSACNQDNAHTGDYLIRVGEVTATRSDFERFWNAYAAPFYANADVDAFFIKVGVEKVWPKNYFNPFPLVKLVKAKVGLRAFFTEVGITQTKQEAFDQFVIAMLLEARAHDLGISVTNEELDAEMSRMMEEYTDDVFAETLRKAAIPFEVWRDGLRRRLLMDKVMRADLYAHGEITPEDVERFGSLRGGVKAAPEEVLERVYRAKAENDFQRWTVELQYKYPVEIDFDQRRAVLNEK